MGFLDAIYCGNSGRVWLTAAGLAALVCVAMWVLRTVLLQRLGRLAERTSTPIDDLAVHVLHGTRTFFVVILALYATTHVLTLPDKLARLAPKIVVLGLLLQVALWGTRALGFATERYARARRDQDPAGATTVAAITFIGRLVLWALVLLLALDNLGIRITTLVAGLGIGGIAVALAVQNILGDLFASLSIVLDRPFVIGDFIVVDDHMGSVEHIGLKTTRIRSLSGEQLVFSNTDLLMSRIRNYKRMQERRIVFSLGVVYQTPAEKLARIPGMLRELIEQQQQVRFDRAHFKEYGDWALQFEIVYWVTNPDYNVYMDIQQSINLAIFRAFEGEGIEFAYPTRTVYVAREDA
jgi:small-conductance mechanosensitive channel